jgi:four helix bundle protein
MDSFEQMPVWQKAMDLAVKVHSITSTLPKSEDYGLTSQMRRSAVSISDNIAEGF